MFNIFFIYIFSQDLETHAEQFLKEVTYAHIYLTKNTVKIYSLHILLQFKITVLFFISIL